MAEKWIERKFAELDTAPLFDRLPPWPALLLLAALAAAFPAAKWWHRRHAPRRAHLARWQGHWWYRLPDRTLADAADHARNLNARDDTEGEL